MTHSYSTPRVVLSICLAASMISCQVDLYRRFHAMYTLSRGHIGSVMAQGDKCAKAVALQYICDIVVDGVLPENARSPS